MIQRSKDNLQAVEEFVAVHPWIDFLASEPAIRSNTSVCLKVDLPTDRIRELVRLLEKRGRPSISLHTGMLRPGCVSGVVPPWRERT